MSLEVPISLLETGDWGEVRYARRSNGSYEARDFLEVASESVKAKFAHLFRRMAATGKINNKEQFRKLDDSIYEFKRDGDRILCFQHGNCWYLTHRYPKSGMKCPPGEIARADTIRSEQLAQL